MPTTAFPPTPGPSTDITARDEKYASSLESSLALPPPALQSAAEHGAHSPKDDRSNKVTCSPESFNNQSSSRSAFASNKNSRQMHDSTGRPSILPSPPTRSRKIIQMKPPRTGPSESQSPTKRRKTGSASNPTPTSTGPTNSSNASNTTSKPTKKAMRKTAHSLIERRRRSKMNDAFSTLKDMIPACRGGSEGEGNNKEMHKLDVLNAGIEYLAYLERCLERMNERQWGWEGKQEGGRSVSGEEDDKEEEEQQQSRKRRSEQHSHEEKEEMHCHCHSHMDCHPDCPRNHSKSAHATLPPSPPPSLEPRAQDHHYSTTSMSPPSSSSSSPSHHWRPIEISRDTDIQIGERDPEAAATARTAAALLMLTSTDRRHNPTSPTTTTKISTASTTITPATPTRDHKASGYEYTKQDLHQQEYGYSETNTSPDSRPQIPFPRSRFTPKASGGGLSVRDLLLGN